MPGYFLDVMRFVKVDRIWPTSRAVVWVAVLAVTTGGFSSASTLVVSNAPTPCIAATTIYSTIQAAVNAATPGATIDVCPGTYPEQVVITIPVILTGVTGGNAANPLITVPVGGVVANTTTARGGTPIPAAAQLLVQNTSGVTVENLAVDGSNSGILDCSTSLVGIYYQSSSGTVNGVSVQNQTGFAACGNSLGVYVETEGAASSTVTIENSTVRFTSGLNIGATYTGTNVTIRNNSVVGSTVSLDNGIYLARGATGTVAGNSVIDFVSAPDTLGDTADASCGIAVSKGSGSITISGNSVGNTEVGICLYSGTSNNSVVNNKIFNSAPNDGVYVCGNNNLVQNNVITSSNDAAIHLDNTACTGFGNSNTITKNVVNGACVGILVPSGTTGNVLTPNTASNVALLKSANICP